MKNQFPNFVIITYFMQFLAHSFVNKKILTCVVYELCRCAVQFFFSGSHQINNVYFVQLNFFLCEIDRIEVVVVQYLKIC